MPSPSVSVVIPLYNHEQYIEAAVASALRQSVAAAEIIVVDDGSTDASAAKVRAFADKHSQIVFWSQPNQGADYTLNAGIHRATGDFVSILNSDDMYCPTRLEECLKVFERDPGCSAVATGLTFVDANGIEITNEWYDEARKFYAQVGNLALALINANFFMTTSNLFARRAVFEEVGYFAPFRYAHDLDFFLRLIVRGKSVRFLEQRLLWYRSHDANTIKENEQRVKVERSAAIASFIFSAWRGNCGDFRSWRDHFKEIAEIADRQTLTDCVDHFLARYELLALPRLGRATPSDHGAADASATEPTTRFPFRGLPHPLANEVTLAELSERIARQEQTIAQLRNEAEKKRVAFGWRWW